MLDILCFVLLLAGQCLFFAAYCKKEPAKGLPAAMLLTTAVLFLTGVFGALRVGVYLVIALSLAMAAAGVLHAKRRGGLAALGRCMATPAAAMFLFVLCWSVYANFGRVADAWDEFSHWADTVKRMTALHAIPTAADGAQFPSYPPAMALLQYFVQVLTGGGFVEWKLYVTYQLFSAAVLLPLFDGLSLRDGIGRSLLGLMLLLVLPMALFYHPIGKLFIDGFLGLLFGAALCFSMGRAADAFDRAVFCLLLFVLVLTKEVGLLFALLAAAIVAVETLVLRGTDTRSMLRRIGGVGAAFASIGAAKLLWNGFTAQQAVDGSQGLSTIRGGVLTALGEDSAAAIAVVKNYVQEFFSFTQRVGMMKMSFFTLLVLCLVGVAVLLSQKRENDPAGFARLRFRLLAAVCALLVYIASLLFLYITWSVYSPYEAAALSSFDRYLNTGFAAFLVCLAAAGWHALDDLGTKRRARQIAAMFVVAVLLLPLPDLMELGLRKTVRESVETRAPYAAAVEYAEAAGFSEGARVLVVAQDTAGLEWQHARYCLAPRLQIEGTVWSFRLPGDTNNIWTTYLSAEDFAAQYGKTYDYVLLLMLDEYFMQHYAPCFAAGTEIVEGGWYRFDAESGLLVAA